jgi:hypothetical protein
VGLDLGVHGEPNKSDLKMKSGVEEGIDLLFYEIGMMQSEIRNLLTGTTNFFMDDLLLDERPQR